MSKSPHYFNAHGSSKITKSPQIKSSGPNVAFNSVVSKKSTNIAHKSSLNAKTWSPNSLNYLPSLKSKSKLMKSKSKRHDPIEIPPMSFMDHVWLLVHFVCLYLFYAAFWYSLWLIYLQLTPATTKPNRPTIKQIMYSKLDEKPVPYGGSSLTYCIRNDTVDHL